MNETVYGRVTKPSQCAWVLGLPVTKDDFYASQARATSDYTKRFWHWPDYRREFLDDYESLRELLLSCGVHVTENATLDEFRDVWHEDILAVVLFSHWSADGIEYRNGIETIDAIAKAIPTTSIATLDLCVCRPQGLVDHLESSHPTLLKRAIWELAEPKIWFMFYKALFMVLSGGQHSYPAAIDEVAATFLANTRSGG